MNEPKEVHVNAAFNLIITITEIVNEVEAVVNIATASAMSIKFASPDGAAADVLAASLYTDGTDGKITASVTSAINNVIGTARVQGFVTLGGNPYPSDIGSIEVLPNLT